MSLGENIKKFRKQLMYKDEDMFLRPYTQLDLSEELGVSVGSVVSWELGRRHPTFRTFLRLCKVLSVTPNQLLDGEVFEDNILVERQKKMRDNHYTKLYTKRPKLTLKD